MLEFIAKINTVVTPANNTVIYLKNTLSRWIFTCQFLAFFTTYFIYNICYAFFSEGLFSLFKYIFHIYIYFYTLYTSFCSNYKFVVLFVFSFKKSNMGLIDLHQLSLFNSLLNIDIDKLYDMYVFFFFKSVLSFLKRCM